MTVTETQGIRERRQAIVDAHIDAENRGDVEATIATFHHPRYEVNGEVSDGAGAVRDLVGGLLGAASDFHAETLALYHTADAVIGEAHISGTHDGQFMGIPATGRRFSHPCACIFDFDEDRLLCEKVYWDLATILQQIGILPEPAAADG